MMPTHNSLPSVPTGSSARPKTSWLAGLKRGWQLLPPDDRSRLTWALGVLGVLTLLFIMPLVELMRYVSGTELHSHIVLIPAVSAYLLSLRWGELPGGYRSSVGWAIVAGVFGLAALAVALGWVDPFGRLSPNDRLAAFALAYVSLVWSGALAVLGHRWFVAALFPLAFLIFLAPLPDSWVHVLERASQDASTEAAAWLFEITGLPNVRDGYVFQLPGTTIEVAEECSGIRSSWVLFITSLVAAEMFLRSQWRRFVLVALVIPLGILRNGFRILVISWLCVEVDPDMINSFIHHRGGPIFFALSLIPLFAILWLLRWSERRRGVRGKG